MASFDEEILHELRRIRQLLAVTATQGKEPTEAVATLAAAGLTYAEIGLIVGLTANAVKLRLRRRRNTKAANPEAQA